MKEASLLREVVGSMLHVLGVTVVFLILLVPYMDSGFVDAYMTALSYEEFRTFGLAEWFIHLGLSCCVWTLLYLTYRIVAKKRHKLRAVRTVRATRGSVLTEFLIILPVWMLISMGLMQLCITNVAGILTNLATFQAARSVWVWAGEAQGNRLGVGYTTVMSKARVQAAMSLAPVAPGDYFHDPFFFVSDDLKAARAGMLAQQLPLLTADQGALGYPLAYVLELEDPKGLITMGSKRGLSLSRSLDSSSFRLRSVRKLTWAYHATTVVPIYIGPAAGAVVVYRHQIAMPLVPQFFGQKSMVMGRQGYYLPITRTFTYVSQRAANSQYPGGNAQ